MVATAETTAVIARFDDQYEAEHYVEELKRAGFRDEEIGFLAPHRELEDDQVEENAVAGAMAGGAVGTPLESWFPP